MKMNKKSDKNQMVDEIAVYQGRRDFLRKSTFVVGGSMVGLTTNLLAADKAGKEKMAIRSGVYCGADLVYPFYGKHQQGIITPQQRHVYFLALDLTTKNLDDVREMFKAWTDYAVRLTRGKMVKPYSKNHFLPPTDTGESYDLSPYGLTLTFGVSPSFLEKLGLAEKAPAEFKEIPSLPRDQLQPQICGGDICIQSCADDPQVAFHAIRQLVRVGRANISLKWSKLGFLGIEGDVTPRNLFGFKDGTANKEVLEQPEEDIWVEENNWLKDGSYLVVRNIAMFLDTWDRTSYGEQENTFGRRRISGAAFDKNDEFEAVDLSKMPDDAHIRLARETGLKLLRRSYSYSDGINPRTGSYDSGLLFICFQKDPKQFIGIQRALGNVDALNEYITHIGSALFACFGGVKEGEYIGQALLG